MKFGNYSKEDSLDEEEILLQHEIKIEKQIEENFWKEEKSKDDFQDMINSDKYIKAKEEGYEKGYKVGMAKGNCMANPYHSLVEHGKFYGWVYGFWDGYEGKAPNENIT